MNPWSFWSADRIARVTGCPLGAVSEHWPRIAAALDARGILDRPNAIGVIATVAVETRSFEPIHEGGSPANWAGYEGGSAYAGRGFIQLTHLSNYRAAGRALGVDLVGNPDLALDPDIAARILAWFWSTRGVRSKDGRRWYGLPDLCREPDWEWVRRVVNGGTAQLDRFLAVVAALDAAKESPMTDRLVTNDDANFRPAPGLSNTPIQTLKKGSPVWPTGAGKVTADGHTWVPVALGPVGYIAEELLTGEPAKPDVPVNPRFNPDAPVITQNADWDCAQQATLWALTAIGRHPSDDWMEADMLARGVESMEVGLTDATGARLAAWIREQYGEFGIGAYNLAPVSFAQVSHLAGSTPVLIGGHGWGAAGHWAGVRRYRNDVLEIAQVGGHGPVYGQQTLDRAAWDARGPWSAVVIERKA